MVFGRYIICNYYRVCYDSIRSNQTLSRLTTYTAFVVTILVVVAIVYGDMIGLAWHEVKINPCRTERAVREDATQTTYTRTFEFRLEHKSLVDDGHTSHILMVVKGVKRITRVSDIDVVERILDVFIHTAFNPEHLLISICWLLVHIWT